MPCEYPANGRYSRSLPTKHALLRNHLDNRPGFLLHRAPSRVPPLGYQPAPIPMLPAASAALRSNNRAGTRTSSTLRRSVMQVLLPPVLLAMPGQHADSLARAPALLSTCFAADP